MERLVMGRIWFVFFSSFLVLLVVSFFSDFSSLIHDQHNDVTFLIDSYSNFIDSHDFNRSEEVSGSGIDPFRQQPNPPAKNRAVPAIGENVTQNATNPPPKNGPIPVKNGPIPAIRENLTQNATNPPPKNGPIPAIGENVTLNANNPPPPSPAKNGPIPAIDNQVTQNAVNTPARNGPTPAIGENVTQKATNFPPSPPAKNGPIPAIGKQSTHIAANIPADPPARNGPIPAIGKHPTQNAATPPANNGENPVTGKQGSDSPAEFLTVEGKNRDKCTGRYIYVHDLPSRFNDDVLKNCESLIKWFDMCVYLQNSGLGPPIPDSDHLFPTESWYSTSQFTLEQIFRNRMRQYDCLTNNSSLAAAVYVPVYIGLDTGRHLWDSSAAARDSMALDLVDWLTTTPEWKRLDGRDHFFVAGRISWDFRRIREKDQDWGTVLMRLPEAIKMTMLSIEGTQWRSDFAIPYPTYFHPKTDREVGLWQEKVRKQRRSQLFAFVGAPRPAMKKSIREHLITQCNNSPTNSCSFLNCKEVDCENPVTVMKTFMNTVFCLQPPGDSLTRRSAFDSILAGCIPVFFHPGSAYAQYIWHLPRDYRDYSVFIPAGEVRAGNVTVGEVLGRVPRREVERMRENVIGMIPRVTYADPGAGARLETVEDAFDVTVKGVIGRVEGIRRDREEGREVEVGFVDDSNWFWKLNQTSEPQRWGSFF